jgi:hypothetical protein
MRSIMWRTASSFKQATLLCDSLHPILVGLVDGGKGERATSARPRVFPCSCRTRGTEPAVGIGARSRLGRRSGGARSLAVATRTPAPGRLVTSEIGVPGRRAPRRERDAADADDGDAGHPAGTSIRSSIGCLAVIDDTYTGRGQAAILTRNGERPLRRAAPADAGGLPGRGRTSGER